MDISQPIPNKPRKLLIITSSGGGGLIQTANAKEQQALADDPNLIIVRRDLLKDWIWKPIGLYFINFWNKAQKKGSMSGQKICIIGQPFIDLFLHPTVFFYALYTTFKEDVDHVIDTQPMGTSAIIKALRVFNRVRRKKVLLEKVLVDLPTKKATHFFGPIKRLSKRSRPYLKLTTIAPLLEDGESAEQFWQTTCGLSDREINYEDVYVRQAFGKFKTKDKSLTPSHYCVGFKSKEELALMQKTFGRGSICSKVLINEVEFQIDPTDRVFTVLLGSQPAYQATLGYVQEMVKLAKKYSKAKIHLFVFCADYKNHEKNLFNAVASYIEKMENYPQNLSVVPFSFQTEHVIAPLFFRSDATCTRSGGQTAMELICVSTGEIWIHSEAKKGENLLSGISGWEAASAVYLQKVHGAKIVTPDIFISHASAICA